MPVELLTRAVASIWFGVMAGFFFAYSATVANGLAAAPPEAALLAMQAINANVQNPAFGVAFWGAALIAIAMVAMPLLRPASGARFALAAAIVYLAGALSVTALGNVPLNRALAIVDATGPEAAAEIAAYLRDWTLLNHLRTAASICAFVLALLALVRAAQTRGSV